MFSAVASSTNFPARMTARERCLAGAQFAQKPARFARLNLRYSCAHRSGEMPSRLPPAPEWKNKLQSCVRRRKTHDLYILQPGFPARGDDLNFGNFLLPFWI